MIINGRPSELTIDDRLIRLQAGEQIKADQPVIVLESMKMENEIRAPFDVKVPSIVVSAGETIARGAVLAEIS